jgi:transcriptional regulator with XRE-family HTH domain
MSNTSKSSAHYVHLEPMFHVVGPENNIPVRWIAEQFPDPEDQREYARERCRIVLTEAIGEAIEESGLSRSQIAEKLGVTKGYVSQVLSGSRNMTLRTLGDLMWACDRELQDVATRQFGVVMTTPESVFEWGQSLWNDSVAGESESAIVSSQPVSVMPGAPADTVANNNLALAA